MGREGLKFRFAGHARILENVTPLIANLGGYRAPQSKGDYRIRAATLLYPIQE